MTPSVLDKLDPSCAFAAFLTEHPEYNDPEHVTEEDGKLSFSESCLKAYVKYAEAFGTITPHAAENWLATIDRAKRQLVESGDTTISYPMPNL